MAVCLLMVCISFLSPAQSGHIWRIGAIFLEAVPKTHQWLLTLLSAWWSLGQLFASLVAWPLIGNFSCLSAADCPKSINMGWRYTLWAQTMLSIKEYVLMFICAQLYTVGDILYSNRSRNLILRSRGGVTLLMWILRYVVFNLQESSKYLVAKGRDEEAIKVCSEMRVHVMMNALLLAGLGTYRSCKWKNDYSYSRETASYLGWWKRAICSVDYPANLQKVIFVFLTVNINCLEPTRCWALFLALMSDLYSLLADWLPILVSSVLSSVFFFPTTDFW